MGLSWKDFDPSNVVRSVSNTVSNPSKKFSQATGIKIPGKIKIGGTTIGTDSGLEGAVKQLRSSVRDLDNTRVQAAKDRENASRGEVGKFYAGYTRNLNNLNPLAIAEKTARGQSLEVSGKKGIGTFLSNQGGLGGLATMAGNSSTFQREARTEGSKKWTLGFSENFAGYGRGSNTLASTGDLSNDDRNNIIQTYVKVGAVAAGGGWLESLFGGGAAATPASEGAVLVESGTPYYTGSGVVSAEAGGGAVASGIGAGSAAAPVAASTPWAAYGTNAALGYSLLTGKQAPTSIGDLITNPESRPDMGFIGDLLGNKKGPYISPDITGDGSAAYGGDNVASEINPFVLGGLALAAFFVVRKIA